MSLERSLETLKIHFQDKVKPILEEGDWATAQIQIANEYYLLEREQAQLLDLRIGPLFLAASKVLMRDLKDKNERDIRASATIYEAYMGQLGLNSYTKKQETN